MDPVFLVLASSVLSWPVATAAHELGHAIAGWAVGWKVRSVTLGRGPHVCAFKLGATRFGVARWFFVGGQTEYAWTSLTAWRWKHLVAIAGGPTANFGLVLLCWREFHAWGPYPAALWWGFGSTNLTMTAANLLLLGRRDQPSDGVRIWRDLATRDHVETLIPRLAAQVKAGAAEDALHTAALVVRLIERHPLANLLLGLRLGEDQDYTRVAAHLGWCTQRGAWPPDVHAMAQNLYAWARLRSEPGPAAVETVTAAKAALAHMPDSAAYLDTCGEALVRAAEVEAGMALLERVWASEEAIALLPESRAFTACGLARGWAARGDAGRATEWLGTAEAADPACPALTDARVAVSAGVANIPRTARG